MANAKVYAIRTSRCNYAGDLREHIYTGTLPELIDTFSYTLEKGFCYQNERGNKKINRQPKTAAALVNNLNNAEHNSNRGYNLTCYDLVEVSA